MIQLSYKTKCILFLLLVSISVILSVKFILPYFFTFLFAYWLAKYAVPIAFYLQHKLHIPRTISNLFTLLLILSVVGVLLFLIFHSLIQQFNRLMEQIPVYKQTIFDGISNVCSCCDNWLNFKDGTTFEYIIAYGETILNKSNGSVFPTFTKQTVAIMCQTFRIFAQSGILILSALLMIQDYEKLKKLYHSWFLHDDIDQIVTKLSSTGLTYMKMQCVIIAVIAVLCTIGLFLSHSSYPLLIGILIAVLDALPLFGSGTILIPWAIIELISHNVIGAAILMSTYLLCQITRQFLESRLLGDTLGLAPIYFVMSLFIGIEFYGLSGVILGPFSVLLIKTLYQLYKPKPTGN